MYSFNFVFKHSIMTFSFLIILYEMYQHLWNYHMEIITHEDCFSEKEENEKHYWY